MPMSASISEADQLLSAKADILTGALLSYSKGHEREALIQIVRSADDAAFSNRFHPYDATTHFRHVNIFRGVAPALAAILPRVDAPVGSGLPTSPSTNESARRFDGNLFELGKIAGLRRLLALEASGLTRSTVAGTDKIRIEVPADDAEASDREASRWLSDQTAQRITARTRDSIGHERIVDLLDRTSEIRNGWQIAYEGHDELLAYYLDQAAAEVIACQEYEALPPTAMIGGRTFAKWRSLCILWLGRSFNHIAYATRLRRRHPHLMLRNLITIYALRKDLLAVWEEAGEEPHRASQTISHITLNASSIGVWQEHHEIPAPFYIDVGGDWFMIPVFGGLLNPVCGLVRTLRLVYRRDWDIAVGGREKDFREDLHVQFPAGRFDVPAKGFVIRRADGSQLTDVDAVIIDNQTGAVGIVQLKWPDAFGLSPRERESRRRNLLEANEWVERVANWIGGRSSGQVCAALGIKGINANTRPYLMVLSRYATRFTNNDRFDSRAAWLSWPELVRLRATEPDLENPLDEIQKRFLAGGQLVQQPRPPDAFYEIGNLKVHVAVV